MAWGLVTESEKVGSGQELKTEDRCTIRENRLGCWGGALVSPLPRMRIRTYKPRNNLPQ